MMKPERPRFTGTTPSRRSFSLPPLARRLALALPFFLAVAAGDPARAEAPPAGSFVSEDWPRFLGPRGDQKSAETGILAEWPAAGLRSILRWGRMVGSAYSSPVIADGRLVLFHRVEDEEVLEGIEAATGKTLWKFSYPTAYEDRYGYNDGPRSAPTIDGEFAYANGAEGVLSCVRAADGRLVWQRRVNAEYEVPQGFFGAGCAPVIEGDLVLFEVGSERAQVAAFDKRDGRTLWTAGSGEASYSTPTVATLHGERVALFLTRDGLLGVRVADGEVLYRHPFRSKTNESVNAATPLMIDADRVFLSATYNMGATLLKLKPGAATGDPPDNLEVVWADRLAMQNHWATSLLHGGLLYGVDGRHEGGSNLRCIDSATGEVKWTEDAGLGRATFLEVEGRLIALGERGEVAIARIDPERYVELSRAKALRYPCWTPPALARGLLYLRNEDTLLCLDVRSDARKMAEAASAPGSPAPSSPVPSAPASAAPSATSASAPSNPSPSQEPAP